MISPTRSYLQLGLMYLHTHQKGGRGINVVSIAVGNAIGIGEGNAEGNDKVNAKANAVAA
jgi:hypothetical protein